MAHLMSVISDLTCASYPCNFLMKLVVEQKRMFPTNTILVDTWRRMLDHSVKDLVKAVGSKRKNHQNKKGNKNDIGHVMYNLMSKQARIGLKSCNNHARPILPGVLLYVRVHATIDQNTFH